MSEDYLKNEKASDLSCVRDRFNRPMHDLRISVIDRCNFRCTYCMPEEESGKHYVFLKEKDWLQFEEISRLVKFFISFGVSKVRLTGGEPLLRPNLDALVKELAALPGIEDLALTTNGALLKEQAVVLKKVGLQRLTVSLDSLDEKIFREMSGGKGSAAQVLEGIREAERAGFKGIKINTVVQRGINEQGLVDLVKYFKGSGHVLRFIEYMDVGNCNHWESKRVVPSREILEKIHAVCPVQPVEANYFGEVASRYQFIDGSGEIGFISSVSQPFCGTCTRARLSTDGKLYTCLFATEGTDMKTPLRAGASDQELMAIIAKVWTQRADKYSENRFLFRSLKEKPKKIEMYQIGG